MSDKSDQPYELIVHGGDRHPSLEALQQDLLEPLADALAMRIREGLRTGEIVVLDGRLVLPEQEAED